MSLAKELLQKVHEAKQAEDEMSIPTYDDLKTPNNHVANSSNATKERKVTGLGDRVEKKPTADIGTPHNEKGRKMSEGENPMQALGIRIDHEGGLVHFSHPGNPEQVYTIEYNNEFRSFLNKTLQRHKDAAQVFDLLHMWYEEGEGNDPQNMTGLNASKGLPPAPPTRNPHEPGPSPMREAANPIVQALNMHADGRNIRLTSPDGTVGMIFPTSPVIQKAINGYITSPDARANTQAAAERLFKMLGNKVPGVKSAEPEAVQGAGQQQSYSQSAGGGIDTSGMSLTPMESKGHKTADGEMNKPTIKAGVPAKSAKVRGKQNDEPKNKGNPGSSKEEKGQEKKQFTVSPKDYKGGENEHKSMKKMHENVRQLESLLGRRLDKVREAYGDRDGDQYIPGHPDFQQQKKPRSARRLVSFLDKFLQPEGNSNGEKSFAAGNPRLVMKGDHAVLDLSHRGDGNSPEGMSAATHSVARQLSKGGFRVQQGDAPAYLMIAVDG